MKTTAHIGSFVAASLLVMPLVAFAQNTPNASSEDDLHVAIQTALLADPRVQNIPPAQFQGLLEALVAEAQAQHMSPADILWQPQRAAAASAVNAPSREACASGWQGYLCQFNQVFGFEGGSYGTPVFLLVTTGLLLAVIWELIVHHRKKLAMKAAAVSGPSMRMR